jgi:hypothetical protein
MKKIYTFLLSTFIFSAAQAQYCTAVGPTSNIDSNVETVQLMGVIGNINYTGCPGVVGLQDLTSLSTTLNAGDPYTISVKFGTCGGNYGGAGTVWIDYDQSGSFDASEVVGTWQGTPPVATSVFNFTVPAGAQNGTTRMRVTQQEAGTLPLDPCATFSWGSVMDFSITIGNGIDCSAYIGDNTTEPVIVASLPYIGTGDNSYCYGNDNLVYPSPDVYYRLNPSPLMESITVSLCGSSFDTFLSVVDVNGDVIAFNDDYDACGTQSGLTFNTAGLGIVYVIVEGWGTNMGAFDIAINANYLAIDEYDIADIKLYPNPTQSTFKLDGIFGSVKVMDLSGKDLLNIQNYQGELIDMSTFSEGVYLIGFEKSGLTGTKKLILTK